MNNSVFSDVLAAFWVIYLIAWWNDWPPVANNEVTVYRISCLTCKPEEMILYREVFRTDFPAQTVTVWMKESGFIHILRDCAIKDKYNWRCDTRNTDSSEPQFVDGVFSEKSFFPAAEQVSWYKWWFAKTIAWMNKKIIPARSGE